MDNLDLEKQLSVSHHLVTKLSYPEKLIHKYSEKFNWDYISKNEKITIKIFKKFHMYILQKFMFDYNTKCTITLDEIEKNINIFSLKYVLMCYKHLTLDFLKNNVKNDDDFRYCTINHEISTETIEKLFEYLYELKILDFSKKNICSLEQLQLSYNFIKKYHRFLNYSYIFDYQLEKEIIEFYINKPNFLKNNGYYLFSNQLDIDPEIFEKYMDKFLSDKSTIISIIDNQVLPADVFIRYYDDIVKLANNQNINTNTYFYYDYYTFLRRCISRDTSNKIKTFLTLKGVSY